MPRQARHREIAEPLTEGLRGELQRALPAPLRRDLRRQRIEALHRRRDGSRRWLVEEGPRLALDDRLEEAPARERDHGRAAGHRLDRRDAEILLAREQERPRAAQVAEAVIRIRRRKLPDPAVVGNAGSFFKNPIVPAAQAEALRAGHPALPVFPATDGHAKLSAAWLIDQCGFKGHRDGDAGVSPAHALVLINHGHASGAQLLALARDIAAAVHARFGVAIEPEPRIVGARW